MGVIVREMKESDRGSVTEMMRVFYSSDAVHTDGSAEIFEADFDECVSESPFLSGFVLEYGGEAVGYAMTAHSFSTEFGKRCVWLEDLYIKDAYRGKGFGSAFFDYIEALYPGMLFRLEAEEENRGAVALYRKRGYGTLPYLEMVKGI